MAPPARGGGVPPDASGALPAVVVLQGKEIVDPSGEPAARDPSAAADGGGGGGAPSSTALSEVIAEDWQRKWAMEEAGAAWQRGFKENRRAFRSAVLYCELQFDAALKRSRELGEGSPNAFLTLAACECVQLLLGALGEKVRPLGRVLCTELFRAVYADYDDASRSAPRAGAGAAAAGGGGAGALARAPGARHTPYYVELQRARAQLGGALAEVGHVRALGERAQAAVRARAEQLDEAVGSLRHAAAQVAAEGEGADALGARVDALGAELRAANAELGEAVRFAYATSVDEALARVDALHADARRAFARRACGAVLAPWLASLPAPELVAAAQEMLAGVGLEEGVALVGALVGALALEGGDALRAEVVRAALELPAGAAEGAWGAALGALLQHGGGLGPEPSGLSAQTGTEAALESAGASAEPSALEGSSGADASAAASAARVGAGAGAARAAAGAAAGAAAARSFAHRPHGAPARRAGEEGEEGGEEEEAGELAPLPAAPTVGASPPVARTRLGAAEAAAARRAHALTAESLAEAQAAEAAADSPLDATGAVLGMWSEALDVARPEDRSASASSKSSGGVLATLRRARSPEPPSPRTAAAADGDAAAAAAAERAGELGALALELKLRQKQPLVGSGERAQRRGSSRSTGGGARARVGGGVSLPPAVRPHPRRASAASGVGAELRRHLGAGAGGLGHGAAAEREVAERLAAVRAARQAAAAARPQHAAPPSAGGGGAPGGADGVALGALELFAATALPPLLAHPQQAATTHAQPPAARGGAAGAGGASLRRGSTQVRIDEGAAIAAAFAEAKRKGTRPDHRPSLAHATAAAAASAAAVFDAAAAAETAAAEEEGADDAAGDAALAGRVEAAVARVLAEVEARAAQHADALGAARAALVARSVTRAPLRDGRVVLGNEDVAVLIAPTPVWLAHKEWAAPPPPPPRRQLPPSPPKPKAAAAPPPPSGGGGGGAARKSSGVPSSALAAIAAAAAAAEEAAEAHAAAAGGALAHAVPLDDEGRPLPPDALAGGGGVGGGSHSGMDEGALWLRARARAEAAALDAEGAAAQPPPVGVRACVLLHLCVLQAFLEAEANVEMREQTLGGFTADWFLLRYGNAAPARRALRAFAASMQAHRLALARARHGTLDVFCALCEGGHAERPRLDFFLALLRCMCAEGRAALRLQADNAAARLEVRPDGTVRLRPASALAQPADGGGARLETMSLLELLWPLRPRASDGAEPAARVAKAVRGAAARVLEAGFPVAAARVVLMSVLGGGACSAQMLAETLAEFDELPLAHGDEVLARARPEGARPRAASARAKPAPGAAAAAAAGAPAAAPAAEPSPGGGRRRGGGGAYVLDPCAFVTFCMQRWEAAREEGRSRLLDVADALDGAAPVGGAPSARDVHTALAAVAPAVQPAESAWVYREALRASAAYPGGGGARLVRDALADAAQARGVLACAQPHLALVPVAPLSAAERAVGLCAHWELLRTELDAMLVGARAPPAELEAARAQMGALTRALRSTAEYVAAEQPELDPLCAEGTPVLDELLGEVHAAIEAAHALRERSVRGAAAAARAAAAGEPLE